MTELDPAAFADLLAGYCLEVQAGENGARALDPLAAPLLLELQRAILEREAWPLLRVELPGQTPSYYAHALERHLDDYPDWRHRGQEDRRALGSRPRGHRELADVDPDRIAGSPAPGARSARRR